MKPAAVVRLGGLVAMVSLSGACQLAFGLGDYAGATSGVSGGAPGGASAGGNGAGGAGGAGTTTTTTSGVGGGGGGGGATTTGTPTPTGPCVCSDPPPDGWAFVRVFRAATEEAMLSGCGNGVPPLKLHEGPQRVPVACGACSCADPTPANCQGAALQCGGDAKCAGADDLGVTEQCTYVGGGLGSSFKGSCKLAAEGGTVVGTCAPQGGGVTDRPAWTAHLSVCPAETDPQPKPECTTTCIAPVPGATTCVRHDGNVPCVVPAFPAKLDAWSGANDTRECSACACDATGVSCAGGSVTFHLVGPGLGNDCSGSNKPVTGPSCVELDNVWGAVRHPPAPQGACAASGGLPAGSFDPTGPATICCP